MNFVNGYSSFEYTNPYNKTVGKCDVLHSDRVVILSEMPDNPGMSITNAIESVIGQLCKFYEIDPRNYIWIEHYSSEKDRKDTYDLIQFNIIFRPMERQMYKIEQPHWIRLHNSVVTALFRNKEFLVQDLES